MKKQEFLALLLSFSSTPVPDMVALAATITQDGVANLDPNARVGSFAVATANVGSGGAITVTADARKMNIPPSVAVCESNPTTGACMAPPSASVTTQINANTTPTFGIFITGNGTIYGDSARPHYPTGPDVTYCSIAAHDARSAGRHWCTNTAAPAPCDKL